MVEEEVISVISPSCREACFLPELHDWDPACSLQLDTCDDLYYVAESTLPCMLLSSIHNELGTGWADGQQLKQVFSNIHDEWRIKNKKNFLCSTFILESELRFITADWTATFT